VDLIDLFDRGKEWTASKIPAAFDQLDVPTPCDEWDVCALLNHLLSAQKHFAEAPHDESAKLPQGTPPTLLGDDAVKQYAKARETTLRVYQAPGVLEKTGPALGIAFVDQLVHGWDLAQATGQDATMPEDLAEAALAMVDGRMPDDQRGTFFKPAVPVAGDASAQARLLGYGGRQPSP
jgi:uncharacterized protein (TIGR03086 family)